MKTLRRTFSRLLLLLALAIFFGCTVHVGSPANAPASSYKRAHFTVFEDITYSEGGDDSLAGDLYVPMGNGPFPTVLLIHGGNWSGGQRSIMDGFARRLSRRGFVVFNIDYRLAPAHHFPAQLSDCKQAVRWVRQHAAMYNIDRHKIGAWGYSAGAHLAAILGTAGGKGPGSFEGIQAVVAGSGPYNLSKYPENFSVRQFLGATIEENPDIFREASPVFQVDRATAPMFLYHGTWDDTVDVAHSFDMKKALDNAGVPNELHLTRGMGHIALFLFGSSAERNAIAFLNHYLRK